MHENGWSEVRIGELGQVFTGRTPPTEHAGYFGDGFPFITPGDMWQGKYAQSVQRSVSHEGAELLKRIKIPANSVCVSCIGRQMGEAIMTNRPSFTNQQINSIVPNGRVDPSFLYYSLRPRKQELLSLGASTGVRTPILNKSAFCDLKVRLPSLAVQRRISGVLSAYDDLIWNGQRRIRVLEEMARTLYRECVREAGDVKRTKSILECDYWKFISANVSSYEGTKRYYATADIEKLAITGAGIDYTFDEKPSRAQKQPIPFSVWFARMKDTYKIAWYSDVNSQSAESSMLSSGFAGFQALESVFFPLLFLTVSSREFHEQKDLFCTGATQMSLTNEGLSRIQVPAPSTASARKLGTQVLPLLNQMLVLQLKIQNLRRTRDLLLPRLLSGQVSLDVSAVEDVAEPTAPAPPLSQTDLASEAPALRAAEEAPPDPRGTGFQPVGPAGFQPAESTERRQDARAPHSQDGCAPIDQIDRTAVLQVIRQVFSEGPPRERDAAIRDVARALGYRRTGARIHEILHTDLLTAVRRGILENTGGTLRLLARSITDYERDFLKQQFLAAIGRPWIDRDTATRDFCRWLGFARTGPVIEDTTRSLINGLLREGRLEADGADLIRRV